MDRKRVFNLKIKIWWLINIVWLLLFAASAVFIGVRKVDAAGAVQTPEIKMLSFGVLGVVFLFVVIFQLIQLIFIYFINRKRIQ
ncbi:DUF3923 family protein [Lysinibacillus cavernae]|uniref:DUF3923 family protein n=1 Tax=Lysinibacillus cavernae TaxID=2666135 RepID=UPI0012D92A96|nr:DUF3923 family protein [Lysinibacillus cavernae]